MSSSDYVSGGVGALIQPNLYKEEMVGDGWKVRFCNSLSSTSIDFRLSNLIRPDFFSASTSEVVPIARLSAGCIILKKITSAISQMTYARRFSLSSFEFDSADLFSSSTSEVVPLARLSAGCIILKKITSAIPHK
uniref:Ovule protein n=1 Tax=Ascaris lumbricoides TaxID=6252 RepID=A0A0M3I7J4_ASCLU